jgi:hypothetical protein
MGRKKNTEPSVKDQVAAVDNIPTVTPPEELSSREHGDETATEQVAEQKKSSWQPRTTIAVPLTEEAKRDQTKGEVARHVDGYNSRGVGVRIDSPNDSYRPSDHVKEALKEQHPGRDALRWNTEVFDKKAYRKRVIGRRKDGSERNPVAERLDTEDRFEEMVRRRKEEIDKDGGRDPL